MTNQIRAGDIIDLSEDGITTRILVLDIYDDQIFHGFTSSNCVMQFNAMVNITIIGHVDISDELNSLHLKLNQQT